MKKYIRTKDGTIELNREEIEREIIKEADTIEELCDGFEIVRGRFNDSEEARCICVQCETLEEAKSIAVICDIKYVKYEIFGFIWVDGDSVRVAKMNQIGEFILL